MTRDEARPHVTAIMLTIGAGVVFKVPESTADCLIDQFVSLGMLKLDEPKSAEERATQKALDALHHAGWDNHVLNVFDRAGLKIVER